MKRTLWPVVALSALLPALLILMSCSPSSTAPEKGTPAFYWAAAKETWGTGDYVKAIEHLDKIAGTENEYTKRAQPWLLILTAGMSRGNAEIAEHYEIGARNNRADPSPFRRQMSLARSEAGRLALQFAEVFAKFQASKDDPVPLEFPFPTGSATPVPQLTKIAKGMILPAAEADQVHQRVRQRGVLLVLSMAVGAPDDAAKAQEIFKAGNVKVARSTFQLAMADALYNQGQLYTGQKLDDPQKLQLFSTRAQEALKGVPDSKQSKELNTKIQAALKKAKSK